MKIVTVIPLAKGITLTDLTYFTSKEIPSGSIVTVPIRNKNSLGLVVSVEDVSEAKKNIKDMNFNLKKIIDVKDGSIFSKEYLDAVVLAGKYFLASKNNAVTSLIPALFREKYDDIAKFSKKISQEESLSLQAKGNKKNIRAEKLILQTPLDDRISTYKTLIRGSFADKKSIYIIFPSERDIEKFKALLSKGIEQFTFIMHSGLSPKKTMETVEHIITLDHPALVLCTAPFLSIPRRDIGVIILEHECSNGYKMIARPHFDLRILVELFAAKISAKFILSDTLLRFETIARRELDGLMPLAPLSFRLDFPGEIRITGREEKKFKVMLPQSIRQIGSTLERKENVFIFSLRKGLATITICRDCNETVSCERCNAPVVLYLSNDGKKRIYSCNRCKREIDPEIKCKNCGSWNLMPLGIGTDTVSEYAKELILLGELPEDTKVFKLDKESAKDARGAEKIIKEFESTPGSILVGTEMAFSYIKQKVPLSIIASFDSLWSIPNFKMSEKVIHILNSIIENTSEKIIIQTKNEKDPALLAVKNSNLLPFIREELEDRKNLGYPPFKRFIKVIHIGDREKTMRARTMLTENLTEYSPEIFSGFMPKITGKYSTNALIKLSPEKWSLPEISPNGIIEENLSNKLQSLPPSFQVLVDPEDLL